MQNLNVTIIQANLIWEDAKANRQNFDAIFKNIEPNITDIIVLPEMFSTGFTTQPNNLAEKPNGTTVNWMRSWAGRLNTAIVGSLIIEEKKQYYNRLIWMPPTGVPQHYNKKHLFSLAGEHHNYSAGQQRLYINNYKGWNICPLICYDLRFPEWSRNINNYDLLLYVANWPVNRIDAWNSLLKARAIENQTYTIGVNRVGKDGNNISYNGNSAAIDFKGHTMLNIADNEFVTTLTLQKEPLVNFRKRFPFLDDKDDKNLA